MKMKLKLYTTLLAGLTLFGCQKEDDLDRLGDIDFSRPAAIGGRMMSGYHDGALYPKGQEKALPQLLFDRIEAHGGGAFSTPIMSAAGGIGLNPKPWTSIFQTKSELGMRLDCEGVESLGPVKSLYQSTALSDLNQSASNVNGQYQCAPFATLDRMLDPNFGLSYANGNSYPYYHRIASNPGTSTMIGELIEYNPTFLTAWFGMEEVCSYAQTGGTSNTLMDPVIFEKRLDSVMSIMAGNGTKGILLNIPDVKELPYFNLVQYNGANLEQSQADDLNSLFTASNANHIYFKKGDNAFICEDPDAPQGIRHLKSGELLMLTVPLDSMKCQLYGLFGRYFKDVYYLSLDEVAELDATIQAYNKSLVKVANKYDFALFDAHTYFQTVDAGVVWDGADFDFEFVSGGFVGLDGIYPNQKGSALLTNKVIEAINSHYGTHIPNVNCLSCDGALFPE
jgi:hypothetical protein